MHVFPASLPACTHTFMISPCRFLRLRPDKSPEDASGPDLVEQLYNNQSRRIHQQA